MIRRVLLAASLFAAPVLEAQAPPPQPEKLEVAFDLSLLNKTGNTEITTTGISERVTARPGWRWTLTEYAGLTYGKNDGVVLAESYRAGLNIEYAFSALAGAYASQAFERDVFKGLAARYTTSVGLSAILVDIATDRAKVEVGLARVNERTPADVRARFFSGRVAGEYRHNFRPGAYFSSKLEFLPNLRDGEDLRMNSYSEVAAPLSSHFALKTSYLIQYDRQPRIGKKPTDTTLQAGLQITF